MDLKSLLIEEGFWNYVLNILFNSWDKDTSLGSSVRKVATRTTPSADLTNSGHGEAPSSRICIVYRLSHHHTFHHFMTLITSIARKHRVAYIIPNKSTYGDTGS